MLAGPLLALGGAKLDSGRLTGLSKKTTGGNYKLIILVNPVFFPLNYDLEATPFGQIPASGTHLAGINGLLLELFIPSGGGGFKSQLNLTTETLNPKP